jgi:hypothetical protein
MQGSYAILLSDQNGPPNSDGGFTGQFTVGAGGTYSGEGDFEGSGPSSATPTVGPLSGTFAADPNNAGRFTGTFTTNPSFPSGLTAAGTGTVSFYVASASQGFVVETDTLAPSEGLIELQVLSGPSGAAAKHRPAMKLQRSHPKNISQTAGERHGQLSGQTASAHE